MKSTGGVEIANIFHGRSGGNNEVEGGWGDWMECGRGRSGARPGYGGGAREKGEI